MFPHFQSDCYITNDTQLFRILRRSDVPGNHKQLKLHVEDAYQYDAVAGDRVYVVRWLTYAELVDGKYRLVRHDAPKPVAKRRAAATA